MFWTKAKNGTARMEADSDEFLVTAPTREDLKTFAEPLKAH